MPYRSNFSSESLNQTRSTALLSSQTIKQINYWLSRDCIISCVNSISWCEVAQATTQCSVVSFLYRKIDYIMNWRLLVHILCLGVPSREWPHFVICCVVYGTVPCNWYVFASMVNCYKYMIHEFFYDIYKPIVTSHELLPLQLFWNKRTTQ